MHIPSVLSLWLTITTSLSSLSSSSYLRSAISVRESRLLVGSSSRSIFELCRKALARLILYFSPLLSLSPNSPTCVSKRSGSESIKSRSPALAAASMTSSWTAFAFPTRMFSSIVPSKSTVSYSTKLWFWRRSSPEISFKFLSFIFTSPLYGS